jgi:hypothetical protein
VEAVLRDLLHLRVEVQHEVVAGNRLLAADLAEVVPGGVDAVLDDALGAL